MRGKDGESVTGNRGAFVLEKLALRREYDDFRGVRQMLEELCRHAFYQSCKEITDRDMLRLKGDKRPRKYTDFYRRDMRIGYDWDVLPLSYLTGRGSSGQRAANGRRAWNWFNEHENQLRDHYIRARYRGNREAAMDECGTFDALFEGFTTYFAERRDNFMEKTNELIEQKKKELSRMGKHPQSHGGVANLLKVLTKTMHEQGNTIYTIAKVQYQVCMQAGIYIPDEFLTDILVAGEMVNEGRERK